MRHPALRIGGVLLLAMAAIALISYLWISATPRPSAADEGIDAPRDVDEHRPDQPLSQDAWLQAQPRASDPPSAPPPGFWRTASMPAQPQPEPPDRPRLEVIREGRLRNVVLHGTDGRVHALTGFTQPQHVYGAAISPDGTRAWVWHMAFAPRQISVYDLESRELLHRFDQSVGGDMRWAEHDPVIVLEAGGMGMGGARVTVFETDGTPIVHTGVGTYAFSPDDRWLLALPFEQGVGRVEVYRVATGERIFHARLPTSLTLPMLQASWDADDGPILHTTFDRENDTEGAFELARLVPILDRAEDG